jgi:hypothetical protein
MLENPRTYTEKTMSTEGQATKTTLSREEKKCSVDGCRRPYKAKGYCKVHYSKWRKGGFPKPRQKQKKKRKKGES